MSTNGKRKPPRPRIEMLYPRHHPVGSGRAAEQPTGVDSEAAVVIAAVEQFLADTAPPPRSAEPAANPWQRAALEQGIAARQLTGDAWGHAPRLPFGI